MNTNRHRALDGLRGLAVLIVMLSHMSIAGVNLLPALDFRGAGKYGVYLFFVLSSFLLTSQFLRMPATSEWRRPSSWRYWIGYALRRICRIYPMFGLALLVATFFPFMESALMGPNSWTTTGHLLLTEGVKIFWAIPVEVKFYALLPLLLLAMDRFVAKRGYAVAVVIIVAAILKEWVVPASSFPGKSIALTRYVSVFLCGTAAAVVWNITDGEHPPAFLKGSAGFFATAALLVVVSTMPSVFRAWVDPNISNAHFHVAMLTYGGLWSVVVLGTLWSDGVVRRVFEWTPLCWLGTISFSAYLWHLPVIEWLRRAMAVYPFILQATAILIVVLVVSSLSYLVIERPIIGWAASRSRALEQR